MTTGITIFSSYTIEAWVRPISGLYTRNGIFDAIGTHELRFVVDTTNHSARLRTNTGVSDIYDTAAGTVPLNYWSLLTYKCDYNNPNIEVIAYINAVNSAAYYVGNPISHVSTDYHQIGRDLE